MLFKFADNRNPHSWASRLRQRRVALFLELIAQLPDPVRVLDVGGSPEFWRVCREHCARALQITLLNLDLKLRSDEYELVSGDARNLHQFADNSFDACFSNSLLEHVGTFYDQQRAASEIMRVAPIYFVQTPNRNFPIEPHFLVPGFQFLPLGVRATLHQRLPLGWMARQPDQVLARAEVEQVRLLTYAELARLFPNARLLREQVGPFTKALIAMRGPGAC